MDPNSLDPKLKETYDRVMDTPTAPKANPATPASTPTSANPMVNTSQATGPVIPTDMSQAIPTTPSYTQDNLNFQAAIQTPVVGAPLGAPGAVVQPQQKTSSLLRVFYVIGAIVFFVAYTFLWIKIFNLPLPF